MKILLATGLVLSATLFAPAQTTAPANSGNSGFPFKETSILKPPAGAKVALYEFEDMECPVCAGDAPAVRAAAAHYKIPFLRRDFPLTEIHIWSLDAAITARYLQDKVSPAVAEDFRRDVFASQFLIASKDDLGAFTRRWFQARKLSQPFVMDASGACRNEVKSDRALGDRLGVRGTPCLFVVTQTSWVQVTDIKLLYRTIDLALAQSKAPATAPHRAKPARL
jgi:protein-disulfide isomerase